jgi:hypothetical protein
MTEAKERLTEVTAAYAHGARGPDGRVHVIAHGQQLIVDANDSAVKPLMGSLYLPVRRR